jgi:hypothetical protein
VATRGACAAGRPDAAHREGFSNAHEGQRSALTINTASQKPHRSAKSRAFGRADEVVE